MKDPWCMLRVRLSTRRALDALRQAREAARQAGCLHVHQGDSIETYDQVVCYLLAHKAAQVRRRKVCQRRESRLYRAYCNSCNG